MDEELADALHLATEPLLSLVCQAMCLRDGKIWVGQAVQDDVMPTGARSDVDFVTATQAIHTFYDSQDFVT
jgi:hypothetical protein